MALSGWAGSSGGSKVASRTSVGMAGRLGAAETGHWSTCFDGHRVDFFNGSSGLEEQCSHEPVRNRMAFEDLASEVT